MSPGPFIPWWTHNMHGGTVTTHPYRQALSSAAAQSMSGDISVKSNIDNGYFLRLKTVTELRKNITTVPAPALCSNTHIKWPPATACLLSEIKTGSTQTLYSTHSIFPNGHHRTRHGSVLRTLNEIKHNTQSQKELFFQIPKRLDSTPRRGVNCAASTKTPANWLKEKTHKSKVFHKVKFCSHLRQSYFITEEFFFFLFVFFFVETMRLRRLIVFSRFCSRLTPLPSEDVDANLRSDSSRCVRSEKYEYVFFSRCEVLAPFWHGLNRSWSRALSKWLTTRAHTHTPTQSLVVIENELHPRSDSSRGTWSCVRFTLNCSVPQF